MHGFKQNLNINIQKPEIISINSIIKLGKKVLLILTLTLLLSKNALNIAIIGIKSYFAVSKLKNSQIFAISKKNPEF